MTDFRWAALALLAAMATTYLVGVRAVFRRPRERHRYRASLVSAVVLGAEAVGIGLRPVPALRFASSALLVGLALALFVWAARVNRARPLSLAFAAHAPEHVQTRGPYALVRHPFYTSYLLGFVGGFLAAGTSWLSPALVLGGLTYWSAARREEAAFEESPLRDEYRAYARRVGMFVPRRAPAPTASS